MRKWRPIIPQIQTTLIDPEIEKLLPLQIPNYEEILRQLHESFTEIYGDTVDLSEETHAGQMLLTMATNLLDTTTNIGNLYNDRIKAP